MCEQGSEGDCSCDELFVGAIKSNGQSKAWFVELEVKGKSVKFKFDTGAEVNVMPVNVFALFQKFIPVKETQVRLSSYSDHNIGVVGKVTLPCKIDGEPSQELELFVANVTSTPVLGVVACEKLNLVKKIHGVEVLINRKLKKGLTKECVQKRVRRCLEVWVKCQANITLC